MSAPTIGTNRLYFESPLINVDEQQLVIRIRDMSPIEAEALLSEHNDVNRPLSRLSVEKLTRDMRDGTFRVNGDTICRDVDDRILDGQNRLRAIADSRKPQTVIEIVGLDPKVMDTKDLGKSRTVSDILVINGYNIKEAATVVGAASIMMIGSKHLSGHANDRKRIAAYVVANLERLQDAAIWAKGVAKSSDKVRIRTSNRHILSSGPLAALSMIMEDQGANREEVRAYFRALATGTIPPDLGMVTEKERFELINAMRNWLRLSYPLIREGGSQFQQLLRIMSTLVLAFNRLKKPEGDILRQVRLSKINDRHYDAATFPRAL